MSNIRHLNKHINTYGVDKNLFTAAFMVLFFVIFDGIGMYLAPIVMQNHGVAIGQIGLIIGLSSVAGMLFDIVLGRLIENNTYKTIFLFMLLIAAIYPFFLFGSNTITMYLIAMAIWGLYYNLYNIGALDFVGDIENKDKHTSSFGVLKVFDGLGYLIAPFLASIFLIYLSLKDISYYMLMILIPAFIFYFILCKMKHPLVINKTNTKNLYSILTEVKIWDKIGHILLPILLLTLTINLVDSAIWTIGPIFSESLHLKNNFSGGAFMLAYTLPPLLVGWIVGRFVARYGKKKVALYALLLGSILVTFVGLVTNPLLAIAIIFGTSFCFALAWPSINAAYADDIAAKTEHSKELENVEDLFTNIGDTLGPILGGYAAQFLTVSHAFIAIGIFGVLAAGILLLYIPDNLVLRV